MEEDGFRREVERARADLVDRAVGSASSAMVEAVETLQILMRSAKAETVCLGAARALLQFVSRRRDDPVAVTLHRATTISPGEVIVEKIVGAALRSIPPGQHGDFIRAIEALSEK
jgi:hypothetical protein